MKHLKILIIGTFLLVLSGFVYKIYESLEQNKKVGDSIKYLPSFSFQSYADTSKYISSEVFQSQKTMIVFFNSTCHFCQDEIQLINDHFDEIEDEGIQVVFVSDQPIHEVQSFRAEQHLEASKLLFLKAKENEFFEMFGSTVVPNAFLYNTKGELIKNIKGFSKLTLITNTFKENETVI
ncbi:peroxiredoxin family protein [Flammeovirga aprica]|uniref:Redoxin domain-containing protein n=1 Tax=Flammeovirga aprica JL-4 TaxID=694437 RepID=A0A7X9XD51_9BACT|nr:redoxin domain-containing protein [Flammeovirga aprica]NME72418.1 redoxin domain-containing protein [Flammeovirga aprica JL-4]